MKRLLVLLVACKSGSNPPPAKPTDAAIAKVAPPVDAAARPAPAPDAAPKPAPDAAPAAVVEPPTVESVHAELVPLVDRWLHHPEARAAMYADGFDHSTFDDADKQLDLNGWLAMVGTLQWDGLGGIGCWLEPGPHQDHIRGTQCEVSYWWHKPTADGYDAGSWQQIYQRETGGKWKIVEETMGSRTGFDNSVAPSATMFADADKLRPDMTMTWSEVALPSGGAMVEVLLTDDKGSKRVLDLPSDGAHCSETPPASGVLLALHCDQGTATDFVIGPIDGESLKVTRTPALDFGVPLPKHAKITRAAK